MKDLILNEIRDVVGGKGTCKCLASNRSIEEDYVNTFRKKSQCIANCCDGEPTSTGWWWSIDGSHGLCPGKSWLKRITGAGFSASFLGFGGGTSGSWSTQYES